MHLGGLWGTKDQNSPLEAIGHVAYQTEDNIKYNEMTLFTPIFFFHILGKVCTLQSFSRGPQPLQNFLRQ